MEHKEVYLLSKDINDNIKHLNSVLNTNDSFDIVHREIEIAGKKACLYCVEGLSKSELMERILDFMMGAGNDKLPQSADEVAKRMIPYGGAGTIKDSSDIVTNVLTGISVLFIDGYDVAFTIDCREYPARGVEEPAKDRVMRGSRDGFVETLVCNTAMIRRRIRTPDLRMEIYKVGESSKTDIALCYMGERVDKDFLENIKNRIKTMKVDALTMNQESFAEMLYRSRWINPFPKFKYSERPDATAACILDGSVAILIDNSPAAMILPGSIFDIAEEADDYYFPPVTGTYLRLSRIMINILTVFLTPTWLLLISNPQLMPKWLEFTFIRDAVNIPVVLQFLILEFSIDGLRLAAINTPNMLSTPLSVMAALIIGDFAASSGWFNKEAMLYMAFVAIANYVQVSFELGYALKFMRLILLVLTAAFNEIGYIAGVIFVFVCIFNNKTVSGKNYLYPLIPFNKRKLVRRIFRVNIRSVNRS